MFNLKDASEKITNEYQKPGITNVTFTGVVLEKTKTNQVPFIKLQTKSDSGEIGNSSQMFLSTEKKAGKSMAAWNVTARNLVDILKSAHNCDDDAAKAMIAVESQDQLVTKLSALLVGKKVRAKFKGETSEKGNIFAILSQTESLHVAPEASSLKFDAARDIKSFQGIPQNNTTTESFSTANNTDLPF